MIHLSELQHNIAIIVRCAPLGTPQVTKKTSLFWPNCISTFWGGNPDSKKKDLPAKGLQKTCQCTSWISSKLHMVSTNTNGGYQFRVSLEHSCLVWVLKKRMPSSYKSRRTQSTYAGGASSWRSVVWDWRLKCSASEIPSNLEKNKNNILLQKISLDGDTLVPSKGTI